MIRHSLTTLSLLALAAAPLAAQKADDPTQKVAGGALPAGWMGRTDRATDKLTDAKFVTMGSGFHVTSGPAAIYWNPKTVTSGPFVASTTVTQTKAPTHPEAYGIFFMGKDLDTPQQNYAYFLVRGDGKYLVNHRAGAEVHKIIPWTDSPAVNKADASGKATNKLTVDASKADSVRLLVNDKQVAALAAAHLGKTDGLVGLRVNHNLDVHIGDLTVTKK
jgi:copper oxidase (laccase) domain-containing protein